MSAPGGELAERFARGLAAERAGRLDEAEHCYRDVVRLAPDRVEGHTNLGVVLARAGRMPEALESLRHGVRLAPDRPEPLTSLATALDLAGDHAGAIDALTRATALRPDYLPATVNLVSALCRVRQYGRAAEAARRSLRSREAQPDVHCALGFALSAAGKLAEAQAAYERAIALQPGLAGAYSGLGHVHSLAHRFHAAIECFNKAIALDPAFADAHGNLGIAHTSAGHLDDALAAYRRGLALDPSAARHSNMLFSMTAHPSIGGAQLLEEHRRWAALYAPPVAGPPPRPLGDPPRRLRVGLVSPDFKFHSVAFFLPGLLGGLDRARFEVVCYSGVAEPDEVTRELEKLADAWRETIDLSDEALCARIREDRIDVLIDLSVHSRDNRLTVFARRPAPLQLTYLGYAGTTGMAAIDYKITDGVLDPPGRTEALHAERLARLPHGYFCYRPDRRLEAPPGPLAARATGCVTFAVFQALPKINAPMIALWARILAEAPGSRLWLKAQGLQEAPSRREFAAAFAAAGVGAERLRLEGWSSFEGYAESLREVDVALDTFPFNGGTTSCHTLWMGVPVVTLRGETAVSRMGLSILGRLGLEALAARTPEEYVATAVALARDLPRLERLRAELRGRMRASALMDETGFARDFGALLESLWREKLAAADA